MALNRVLHTLEPPPSFQSPEGLELVERDSGEDLEELESQVAQMAEKILHYRTTIPNQLKEAIDLLKSAESFDFPSSGPGSEPGTSGDPSQGPERSSELVKGGEKTAEKIKLLKQKTLSNASMAPILLKRMKECISCIDNLSTERSDLHIHPAFKKERADQLM